MHCSKYSAEEISSFSIRFCEGDSDQRAVQQACKESAKFFISPARWLTTTCTTCCSRCRIAHGVRVQRARVRAVQDVALHMGGAGAPCP